MTPITEIAGDERILVFVSGSVHIGTRDFLMGSRSDIFDPAVVSQVQLWRNQQGCAWNAETGNYHWLIYPESTFGTLSYPHPPPWSARFCIARLEE